MDPKVEVVAVRKEFPPSRPGDPGLLVLDRIDLCIHEGEFCSFVGASGCGKSTLMNIIAGLLPATEGQVLIGGRATQGINTSCGYMFQNDTLLPWSTVSGNVRLPLEVRGERDDSIVSDALELVGLKGFEHHYPHQISGGMRKRVQLARLLVQDPEIMIMDEPFGALDAQTRMVIQQEFLNIWDQHKKTVLFVTHDLHEAITLSDRIVLMSRKPGRVKKVYTVDLPRPRSVEEIVSDPQANALFREIWNDLKEEVRASLGGST